MQLHVSVGASFDSWDLCRIFGCGNLDLDHFSGGSTVVPGCILIDCLWLRLLSPVERRPFMNIVIWKSPKALRGILRKIFGMRE